MKTKFILIFLVLIFNLPLLSLSAYSDITAENLTSPVLDGLDTEYTTDFESSAGKTLHVGIYNLEFWLFYDNIIDGSDLNIDYDRDGLADFEIQDNDEMRCDLNDDGALDNARDSVNVTCYLTDGGSIQMYSANGYEFKMINIDTQQLNFWIDGDVTKIMYVDACGNTICAGDENYTNCLIDCAPPEGIEVFCDNNIDDDNDLFTDCFDSDCFGFVGCNETAFNETWVSGELTHANVILDNTRNEYAAINDFEIENNDSYLFFGVNEPSNNIGVYFDDPHKTHDAHIDINADGIHEIVLFAGKQGIGCYTTMPAENITYINNTYYQSCAVSNNDYILVSSLQNELIIQNLTKRGFFWYWIDLNDLQVVTITYCGNLNCETGENYTTCPSDCISGIQPTPIPTPTPPPATPTPTPPPATPTPTPAAGENGSPCNFDSDCVSNNCINGVCCAPSQECCIADSQCTFPETCGALYYCILGTTPTPTPPPATPTPSVIPTTTPTPTPIPTPYPPPFNCGDDICGIGETVTNCLEDCGYCGDSFCYEENISTCFIDCNKCGDFVCSPEFLENKTSCANDCSEKEYEIIEFWQPFYEADMIHKLCVQLKLDNPEVYDPIINYAWVSLNFGTDNSTQMFYDFGERKFCIYIQTDNGTYRQKYNITAFVENHGFKSLNDSFIVTDSYYDVQFNLFITNNKSQALTDEFAYIYLGYEPSKYWTQFSDSYFPYDKNNPVYKCNVNGGTCVIRMFEIGEYEIGLISGNLDMVADYGNFFGKVNINIPLGNSYFDKPEIIDLYVPESELRAAWFGLDIIIFFICIIIVSIVSGVMLYLSGDLKLALSIGVAGWGFLVFLFGLNRLGVF